MLIIMAIAGIMFFVSGGRYVHMALVIVVGIAAVALLIKAAPYRAERLLVFLDSTRDPHGRGYQVNQALIAVGSGGFFGVGFGHSRQKFRFLPEVTGDSIFAIAAEEMGFFVSAGLIAVCSR